MCPVCSLLQWHLAYAQHHWLNVKVMSVTLGRLQVFTEEVHFSFTKADKHTISMLENNFDLKMNANWQSVNLK